MWSAPALCIVCILFGITFDIKEVCSQPRLIQRKTPNEVTKKEADIQRVIDQIHSLSHANTRSSSTAQSADLDSYYNVLSNLYGVFQPLVREGFVDDLPTMLVCIWSGRQDCGLEAELAKTMSMELGQPILTFLSALRSQTCTTVTADGEFSSFFSAYLREGESTTGALSGLQQTLLNMMPNLSVSGNLISAVRGLLDAAATYILKLIASLLETPMNYVTIALQFGIRVPYLDNQETCESGDLKQLIVWGIRNNVSWSFGMSLVDILLDIFLPPEDSTDTYAECQNPSAVPLQRSISETPNGTLSSFKLQCDHNNLATFNDTMCADILTNSGVGSSLSVLTFCQTLSSLSPDQIERAWSNMCYVIQAVVSPLVSRSSDCSAGDTQPLPAVTPLPEPLSVSQSAAPRRVAREASNLKQLACNYDSWLENSVVDAVLVSLCSDNERAEFVRQVCNNAVLMKKLLLDRMNSWLYGYCANSTADQGYMVSQFCAYQQWLDQPSVPVDPSLLEFCMSLDGTRLTSLICEHTGFLMLLISNPENWPIMPNCTNAPPPPPFPDPTSLQLDSCHYSEWHDLMQITTDVLSKCILFDQSGFTREVCSNKTFLNTLLRNEENGWLKQHCNTSLNFPPPEPTEAFNIAGWCDYQTWGQREVDDSVVGLCWQNDQQAFQEQVCCKESVFERLLQNPQNKWLTSVCTDIEEITVPPQVCQYSKWTRPIIVDMTELALCAEIDSLNFTSKVCANETVLQNLLTNQDNTWLIQHCANHSSPGVSPEEGGEQGGGGGRLTGFNAAEQCQYSSWAISPPDIALLTLCWENDQTNFVSSVCPNAGLLVILSREPSSLWVKNMCNTYTNYTTTTSNNSTTTGSDYCLARSVAEKFNWSCSAYLATACQPCATQNMVLQTIVRCWAQNVRPRVVDMLTPPVATVLDQAVSTTVVILLILEEVQSTSWHVIETIRSSVLKSIVDYLNRENDADKKRVLLQCFGTVLTNLLLTKREATKAEMLLIKEYFKLPLSSLRPVLNAAHISTIRMILQYYNSNKDTLQLSDKYLSTMISVLLQTHLVNDVKLFPELSTLLVAASPADIQALPALQHNSNVRDIINNNLGSMTLEQQQAFGLWYSNVMSPSNISRGQQSLIRDTGNLITYLPFQSFQHLSAAQLLDGLDVLKTNTLTPLKQEFIARSLIGTYRNLTAEDFISLGSITCLADPEDLLVYKGTQAFSVIQDNIMNCTRRGLRLPSHLVSNLLLNSTELQVPSLLSTGRLTELVPLLPSVGVTFLQGLTAAQLAAVLPAINSLSFSPAQASIIVEKLLSSNTLSPGQLHELGSLIVGVKTETLLSLTSDRLLPLLIALAQHTQNLCPPHRHGFGPPQANAIASKLWGFPEVVNWLDDVEPLLSCTPLLSILRRTRPLVDTLSITSTKPWNPQQAMALFQELLETNPNFIKQDFLNLGTLGQGVSCKVLHERFQADPSPEAIRRTLALLRQQPGLLHTSLKKCVIDELKKFDFFEDLLEDLGTEIALAIPVSTIKKYSRDNIDTMRKMIVENPRHFLMLSRTKQLLLVDKILQHLGMYTGVFTEGEFRSLGIMAPFVADEVFVKVDRNFFTQSLDVLKELCFYSSKMEIVARILQEPAAFGPVQSWNQTTLNQVDWFLFFLPNAVLQEISPALMTVGRIEKLFMSHRQWSLGTVGVHCLDETERKTFFQKQQFVLQFFLGFLKIQPLSPAPMVPTCEILHTTAPSAWTSSSLTSMSTSAFSNCLELMGHDPHLAPYQRIEVLKKVKRIYGPVSSFSQSVISQLGRIAVELSVEELNSIRLTERRSIAAMGGVGMWTKRQLTALFTTVLNSTRQSPTQLDSSTLVALGHIVCGATPTEMRSFNAVEFSKAVLWLGQLKLSCSEEQLQTLVELLSHRFAFKVMSSWGTDVFAEIGVLAAGLPDIAMSALVKAQIEGITPMAISMIPPEKFAVVLHQDQISMFSYEQAVAVTEEQLSAMSDVQRTALATVLAPSEDRPIIVKGSPTGLALSHRPEGCLILGLLMLLTALHGSGT